MPLEAPDAVPVRGTNGHIAILGGTGFVGRALIERWPIGQRLQLRVLIHRSRPHWLEACGVEAKPFDVETGKGLAQALSGCGVLINLLRPRGDGWLKKVMERLMPTFAQVGVRRYVHCSSIDVYGRASAGRITEQTAAVPKTDYEREHLAVETLAASAPFAVCIVRLGAVFGSGGRNVAVFVKEAQTAPLVKLVLRRALYGKRRLHLVSVEKAADALRFLAQRDSVAAYDCFLVTDDDAPENNFASLQDLLLAAFGRPSLTWVPALPRGVLRLLLYARGAGNIDPMRRFATEKITASGFRSNEDFRLRLADYVRKQADAEGHT
ncbi:MAG: NAD-dependent epimerase/dehydratase family protein [Xanthobacteraceae bacterium]